MEISEESATSHKKYTAALIRFVLRYVLKKWIWIVLAGIIGMGVALWVVLQPKQLYQAEVSFLVSNQVAEQQEMRFKSRDLILEAVHRMEFGKISYFTGTSSSGKEEKYRLSPVKIDLERFPEHFQDQEMRLKILSKGKFRFEFEDFQDQTIGKEGEFGKRFQLGSIAFIPQLTPYFGSSFVDQTVFFTVHSDKNLINTVRQGLQVERLLLSQKKITVRYADYNRLRAEDYLKFLTEVYQKDWEKMDLNKNQLDLLDQKIDDVLMEMHHQEWFNETEQFQSRDISGTMIGQLDSLRLLHTITSRRIEILDNAHDATFPFSEYFTPFVISQSDSSLVELHQNIQTERSKNTPSDHELLQTLSLQFDQLRQTLWENEGQTLKILGERMKETQSLLAVRLLVNKSYLDFDIKSRNPEILFLWAQLFELLEQKEIKMTDLEAKVPQVRVLESPHLLPLNAKGSKISLVISGGLLAAILALSFFVIWGIGTDRLLLHQQLATHFKVPMLAVLPKKTMEISSELLREIHTRIELKRQERDRIWAFAGTKRLSLQGEITSKLAKRIALSGHAVLLVDIQEDSTPFSIPEMPLATSDEPVVLSIASDVESLAAWMLSSQAEDFLLKANNRFDFVLVNLPAIDTLPESIRGIQQSDIFVHLLDASDARKSQVEQLHAYFSEDKPSTYFLFLE